MKIIKILLFFIVLTFLPHFSFSNHSFDNEENEVYEYVWNIANKEKIEPEIKELFLNSVEPFCKGEMKVGLMQFFLKSVVENKKAAEWLESSNKFTSCKNEINFLVKHGFEPKSHNLIKASYMGLVDVVDFYEKAGADLHAQEDFDNKKKVTPLMVASLYGRIDVVRYLVGKGVDPNLKDGELRTALIYSVLEDCEKEMCINQSLVAKALTANIEQENLKDKHNLTALDYVEKHKNKTNYQDLKKVLIAWENKKITDTTVRKDEVKNKLLAEYDAGSGGLANHLRRTSGISEETIQKIREEYVERRLKEDVLRLKQSMGENFINNNNYQAYLINSDYQEVKYKIPQSYVSSFITIWNKRVRTESNNVICHQKQPVYYIEISGEHFYRKFSVDTNGSVLERTKGFFYAENNEPIERQNFSCFRVNTIYLNEIIKNANIKISDGNIDIPQLNVSIEPKALTGPVPFTAEIKVNNHGKYEVMIDSHSDANQFILKPGENRVIKGYKQTRSREYFWEIKVMDRFDNEVTKKFKVKSI